MRNKDYMQTLAEQDARSQRRNSQQIKDAIREEFRLARQIIDRAESENRELTPAEEVSIDKHLDVAGRDAAMTGGQPTGLFAELARVS